MRRFRDARLRVTRWTKLFGLLTVLLISLATRLRRYRSIVKPDLFVAQKKDSSSILIKTHHGNERTQTGEKDKRGHNSYSNYHHKKAGYTTGEGIDFEHILWPRLKKKLCPKGVPEISLGPSLFELGRVEFGLEANVTAASGSDQVLRNRQRTSEFFYDGGFGFTIFLDGEDPANTLFYASVWKCANDQIHSYLHQIFNRRINGDVRDPSRTIHRENDVYRESLNKKDLEFVFHEALNRPKDSSENPSLANEDYFTFNKTSRSKPCIFSVLRDPIGHFLSGYNEVEYRLIHGDVDAPKLSKDSHKLASYTKIPHDESPEKREQRFKTFVKNLIKEHPSFSAFDYYKHFASMSRMLPTMSRFDLIPVAHKNEQWYLPTLDHLTETFPTFLADRCPTMATNYQQRQHQCLQSDTSCKNNDDENTTPFPPMRRMGSHDSSKDVDGTYKAAKDVWNKGGPVAKALCVLHAMDYACFDDLSLPLLCRNVYSSQRFVQGILPESSLEYNSPS